MVCVLPFTRYEGLKVSSLSISVVENFRFSLRANVQTNPDLSTYA